MPRLRILLVWILVGCSDSSGPDGPALGTVVFSAADTGAVMVVDVKTGDAHEVAADGAPFGSISIASDGSAVAYSSSDAGVLDRRVFIADVGTGEQRAIFPSTGQFAPSFRWLRSGWMWYPFASGFAFQTALVGPGRTDARLVGRRNFAVIAESPNGELITYAECMDQPEGRCVHDLVVERPDGSDYQIFLAGVAISAPRFTPDGASVIYAEDSGSGPRLALRLVAGADKRDLGPLQSTTLLEYEAIAGGSLFSPDGTEILAHRVSGLVAVSLDGSGDRAITDQFPLVAAFTPSGNVVYELEVNREIPPDDTPEFEYSSFVVTNSGESWRLRQDDPFCRLARVSATGALVGYQCSTVPIHGIDGTPLLEAGGQFLLGFDATEAGVVVADLGTNQLRYVPLDGGSAMVLGTFLHDGARTIEWPPFDYAP